MSITRPTNLQKPFADSGTKNTIPVASQIGITNGAASYNDGFPPLTMTPIAAGGVPPRGGDMNGVLYDLSAHIHFLNAGGQYRWDSDLVTAVGGYPTGFVIQSDDGLGSYVSLVDSNTYNFNSDSSYIGTYWAPWAGKAVRQRISHANGTADALTATFTPTVTALTDGMTFFIRASLANTTTTPTIKFDALSAVTIVKGAGSALSIGDIVGAGHWLELQYDSTLGKAVLQNPATGLISSNKQIAQITASVASNALTVTLQPTSLDFRSSTLTDGTVNTRTISTSLSLTVPSGASLGTVAATSARLILLAIDYNGTVELAIANLAGGINLDECGLISTTAISASATSASTIYSATARASVPYRVVGFIDITEAAAGTWATAPARIQGCGGQALAAMSTLGYGQTYQNLTSSRAIGTTYYNTTGKPIWVWVNTTNSTGASLVAYVNSIYAAAANTINAAPYAAAVGFIVPPGGAYYITGQTGVGLWIELR